MFIEKKIITSNNQGSPQSNTPKYIVIHDTANSSKSAGAMNHYKWLNNNNDLGRSAHVFVDSTQALQVIEYDRQAFHVGVKYKDVVEVPQCTNSNSIGVEFCINTGGDIEKTLLNLAWVVLTLQKDFNIPLKNVVTHYDVCGKLCPGSFIKNPKLQEQFKTNMIVLNSQNIRFEKALNTLQEKKIINSPDYWKMNKGEYVEQLIINMYDYIVKGVSKCM